MDWDKLRIFHAVAEAGSFTHAGNTLNLSQSAVSRQISSLEDNLKSPLFHRHARGLKLTEQGEILYQAAHEIFAKLAMTEARLIEAKERPEGPLKITTTVAFGSTWLTPRMKEFVTLYPNIEISLVLADSELDLSMREADAAIRMAPPKQPGLIQRRLTTFHHHVFATPEYLQINGLPKCAEDLDDHKIVVYGDDAKPPVDNMNWLLETGISGTTKRRPILKVNSVYGIYRAVESGLGLGALPDYLNQGHNTLVHILPELRGPSIDLFFVYPEELRNAQRIVLLRDFLVERLKPGKF